MTFLLADLAGYTALTEAHGDEHAADVAAEFLTEIRRVAADHDAREVKTIGDAVLLSLPDAADAIRLGARIVFDIGDRERALRVGAGVHTGTAVERDGDWFGSAVNVAARVADLACAGELLVTDAARRAAGGRIPESQFRERGPHELKHVRDPVVVWSVERDGPGPTAGLVIDPVCHMAVDGDTAAESVTHEGRRVCFCSATCRDAFLARPDRYGPQIP